MRFKGRVRAIYKSERSERSTCRSLGTRFFDFYGGKDSIPRVMLITTEPGIKWTIKIWNKKGGSFHFEAVPLRWDLSMFSARKISRRAAWRKRFFIGISRMVESKKKEHTNIHIFRHFYALLEIEKLKKDFLIVKVKDGACNILPIY